MKITELVESLLPADRNPSDLLGASSPATQRLWRYAGGEIHTIALASTLYWQVALRTVELYRTVDRQIGPVWEDPRSEAFVVPHGAPGDTYFASFDLLLLVAPELLDRSPRTIKLELSQGDLALGWTRWRRERQDDLGYQSAGWASTEGLSQRETLLGLASQDVVSEVNRNRSFGVVVAPKPKTEWTASPRPARAVSLPPDPKAVATIGVVASNRSGQRGATTALHAVNGRPSLVDGLPASVISADQTTDSCFLGPLPWGATLPGSSGLKGPLKGMTPRQHETATFRGMSSPGDRSAVIASWSPDLPFVRSGNQLKVLTDAVTSPGDSGAALVDSGDHVLGFAFYRTGVGEPLEFAAWIWAHSVYEAHGLV